MLPNWISRMLRHIVIEPRVTNKQLSDSLGVSQPTIARHRQRLESQGILQNFAYVNTGPNGTGDFTAQKMYILLCSPGITRERVAEAFSSENEKKYLLNKHIFFSCLGEMEGRVAIVVLLSSRVYSDFVDILNGELIPFLRSHLGPDCVESIQDLTVEHVMHMMHNYSGDKSGVFSVSDKDAVYVSDKLSEK